MLYRWEKLMKPDDGKSGGSGGASDGDAATPGTENTNPGGTGNDPGKNDSSKNGKTHGQIVFANDADFQKKVDELLKERLERERQKAAEAAKKAADEAAAEAAKKNGEWQKVAEQRESELKAAIERIAEFDNVQNLAKRYEEVLKKNLDAQRAGLPESISNLLDKLDVAEQLEWLAVNRDSILQRNPDGLPPTPPPSGSGSDAVTTQAKEKFAKDIKRMF